MDPTEAQSQPTPQGARGDVGSAPGGDPRLAARHAFELALRAGGVPCRPGASAAAAAAALPLMELAAAVDAEELAATRFGQSLAEDAETFQALADAAAQAAASLSGGGGGGVCPAALPWLRSLNAVVRDALRLGAHSRGADGGGVWYQLTMHSLLARGIGSSATVAALFFSLAQDVASRRPEWAPLALQAAPLADGSLTYWLLWRADEPAWVLDPWEGEVTALEDLQDFMAPFAGEWGEEEQWFTNANGGVRLGEAQLGEQEEGGVASGGVDVNDANAQELETLGVIAAPLAVEQRWLIAAMLLSLRDCYFGLASSVKQFPEHARPMLPLVGVQPDGGVRLTTEYQQEALNRAVAASERLRLAAYDDSAVARDNGLLLAHADRGWEAISELEEWRKRGAAASEAADRVLLVQERLRLIRRETRAATLAAKKRRRREGKDD